MTVDDHDRLRGVWSKTAHMSDIISWKLPNFLSIIHLSIDEFSCCYFGAEWVFVCVHARGMQKFRCQSAVERKTVTCSLDLVDFYKWCWECVLLTNKSKANQRSPLPGHISRGSKIPFKLINAIFQLDTSRLFACYRVFWKWFLLQCS
jgi:hypothetical protein